MATESAEPSAYTVTFYTGTAKGAGTDSRVFIELFGPLMPGGTQRKWFDNGPGILHPNTQLPPFEKGAKDQFPLGVGRVGDQITKIKVGTDGTGDGASWFCDRVIVAEASVAAVATLATKSDGTVASVTAAGSPAGAGSANASAGKAWTFVCDDWMGGKGKPLEMQLLPEEYGAGAFT